MLHTSKVRSITARVLVFVVVVMATRALIGRSAALTPASGDNSPPPELKIRRSDAPSVSPRIPAQPAQGTVRALHLPQMEVLNIGRQVAVSGAAEAYDVVPGSQYIWLLRVFENNPGKQLLREHHYLEQVFTLAAGEKTMNPTFHDQLELDPGDYKVELSMYAVPPNFAHKETKFGEDMKGKALIKVSNFRKIQILD